MQRHPQKQQQHGQQLAGLRVLWPASASATSLRGGDAQLLLHGFAWSRGCGRVDVAVLPEADWPKALADAHFSTAALAGFTEMTRGLNCAHIDIKSDPAAVEWAGTTTLERVIVELAQRQR